MSDLAVDQATYDLFADDRQFEAVKLMLEPEVKILFGLPEDFYDGPAGTPRPQMYGKDYKVVYRSRPGLAVDPNQGKATNLWPTPRNWRAACSARRRWEM